MDQTLTGNYQLRKENGMDSVPVSSTSSTGNIFSLAGKSYLAKYCGIVLLLWSAVSGFADPASRIEIKVSATPPENLLKNADFEKGLSPWRTGRKSGVELCEGTAHSGKFSLKVTLDSSDRKKHISTKSFYCTRSNLKSPLRPGKSYIISGWMLANPDLRKPPMTYHGAGFSLSVYAKGWKKKANCHITSAGLGRWVHLVSKPVLIPEWAVTPEFHAGIFYVSGTAFFDDMSLTEAYVKLNFQVKSSGLLQVVVEDDAGCLLFDSGELPEKTNEFSKSIEILSSGNYFVRVINRGGNVAEKAYPGRSPAGS